AAPVVAMISAPHSLLDNDALTSVLITVTLFGTAFLFLLNSAFAIAFRKKRVIEVLSFSAASLIELILFAFVLLLRLRILTQVPFSLPAHLPINRAELGGTLALAIGLFPAAYWHRTSMSQLRQRMADDAKVIRNREGGVRIRGNAPGEWLN
ncbi:MAG: hypothetical protein ACRDHW_10570, partial [Ktedonobacteraceae bacterium]